MGNFVRSPRFVARTRELERLQEALEHAHEGRPRVVFVTGDAGVGKTRLVDEFAGRARDAGATVLVGGCLELSDGGLPFGAVREALRGLARERGLGQLRRVAGDDRSDLARIVPELRSIEERRDEALDPPDVATKHRLLQALLGLLERLAEEATVVLVLEDVHWADASTGDLLRYVARAPRPSGVVVVATSRNEAPDARQQTAAVVSAPNVERLDLASFDREELGRFLEVVAGRPPGFELVDRIHTRTHGNAFLARQLLDVRDSDRLPAALRDVLLVAVDALGPPAFEVVRTLAVAGGQARHGLLAAGTELADAALEAALQEAIDAGVVVVDANRGTYAFRHTLLADAVLGDLLPAARSRKHGALAAALEADPRLAVRAAPVELARHWLAAGDDARALAASVEAARHAEAAGGLAEAAEHLRRAVELWATAERPEALAGLTHERLLTWAAQLAHLAGDVVRAVDLQARALETVADGSAVERAPLLERLGRFRWDAGDSTGAEAAYIAAVEALRDGPPSQPQARVLCGYSQLLMLASRHDETERVATEALEIARVVGAGAVAANALNNLGSSRAARGDPSGVELLFEARTLAEAHGEVDDVLRAWMNASGALLELGRFDEAIGVGIDGLDRARSLGVEGLWGGPLSQNIAAAAIAVGRWSLADDVLRLAPLDLGGVGAGWAHISRAELLAHRGRLTEAHAELEAGRALRVHVNEQGWAAFLRVRAAIAAAEGDRVAVRAAVEARRSGPAETRSTLELDVALLRALGEDPDPDLDLVAAVHADAHGLAAQLGRDLPNVATWLAIADAEAADATGRPSNSAALWRAALDRCEADGLVPQTAIAQLRVAEASTADGRPTEAAAELLRAAHRTATTLGHEVLRRRCVALASRLGTRLEGADEPVASVREVAMARWAREGAIWSLTFAGSTVRLPHTKGLGDLAVLLGRPGHEVAATELIGASVEEAPFGPVIDDAARRAYTHRIRALQEDLDEATAFGDLARADRARTELDQLVDALTAATGIGGRTRRAGGTAEKARSAVTHRIREAIRRVATVHPALGEHLTGSIRTGRWCRYDPGPDAPEWAVEQA